MVMTNRGDGLGMLEIAPVGCHEAYVSLAVTGAKPWDKMHWTNPRSGSRVSRRRRAHDSQCAGCHRVNWIICRSRPIMAKVCAKKLSGESAKREVPDPVAPIHLTASRGLFARWGESS